MKLRYLIPILLLILVLIVGCVQKLTPPEEEVPEETLGISTQEELFEAVRTAVNEHLKE